MWLLGPPDPAHITLAHVAARWAQGVLQFGGAATIGAAVGRLLSARLPFGLLQGAPRQVRRDQPRECLSLQISRVPHRLRPSPPRHRSRALGNHLIWREFHRCDVRAEGIGHCNSESTPADRSTSCREPGCPMRIRNCVVTLLLASYHSRSLGRPNVDSGRDRPSPMHYCTTIGPPLWHSCHQTRVVRYRSPNTARTPSPTHRIPFLIDPGTTML